MSKFNEKDLKKLRGIYRSAERGLKLDSARKSTYYLKNIFPQIIEAGLGR